MECLICHKDYNRLGRHIVLSHMLYKEYYDNFLKKGKEGVCLACGKETKFVKVKYNTYCSHKCSYIHTIKSREDTCLQRYGESAPIKNYAVKQKVEGTCKKKYGVECSLHNREVKQKIKETCLKRFGTEYPLQNSVLLEKRRNTWLNKYGVEHPSQSKTIMNKCRSLEVEKFLVSMPETLLKEHVEAVSFFKNTYEFGQVRCKLCNTTFETSFAYLRRNIGKCPVCFPKTKSLGEQELASFIESLGIKVVLNSRIIIPPQEIDIYIPDKHIAIEYNGLYWHAEDKRRHVEKLSICSANGIRLIQIFEDEWLFKQDIVKARIKQILSVADTEKVYARKCVIRNIDNNEKNVFLDDNHVQGKDKSKVNLGAFYNNILVAVMTFSNGSIARGVQHVRKDIWELSRFCCSMSFRVIGIASKLLAYFTSNYMWYFIYTFADRRWSIGNVYEKLGFTFDKITQPNYFYIRGSNRVHRYTLRKRQDEPKDIPEWKLRKDQGYLRIWDCGHLKYKLSNTAYSV